eukprot:gene14526-biopygen9644
MPLCWKHKTYGSRQVSRSDACFPSEEAGRRRRGVSKLQPGGRRGHGLAAHAGTGGSKALGAVEVVFGGQAARRGVAGGGGPFPTFCANHFQFASLPPRLVPRCGLPRARAPGAQMIRVGAGSSPAFQRLASRALSRFLARGWRERRIKRHTYVVWHGTLNKSSVRAQSGSVQFILGTFLLSPADSGRSPAQSSSVRAHSGSVQLSAGSVRLSPAQCGLIPASSSVRVQFSSVHPTV